MRKSRTLAAGCSALVLAAVTMFVSPSAQAESTTQAAPTALPSPDTVLQAWNDSFLVRSNGESFHTTTLKSQGTQRSGTWIAALNIMVAQDAYERTRTPEGRQLIEELVSTFHKYDGTTWASWDGWNDDIAWMVMATLRGYHATGNQDWLNVAIDQWNKTYDRGWSSHGGGGIWEAMDPRYSKCALSNDPMIINAVWLYQITGDGVYLTKAKQIYEWVRANLVDGDTGVVNECIAFPDGIDGRTELQASDNAYNAGAFIEAADNLYRVTGDTRYRDDAQRTADHFLNDIPIVSNNQTRGSSYQYWLFKGINSFCTDANLCNRYDAYMRRNAEQAWNMRNSANLTWNEWTRPTNFANPDAFMMNGMVGLYQNLPSTEASPFSGRYKIENVTSGLALGVQGNSTDNAVPVVQNPDTGDPSSSWTFVQRSNGYYEITNSRSGQTLNVAAASGKPGAPVVQWPAGSIHEGNDQWKPIRNSDGTYSFYNRNSKMALDNPAGSTTAGTQLIQWTANHTDGQKFRLTSR